MMMMTKNSFNVIAPREKTETAAVKKNIRLSMNIDPRTPMANDYHPDDPNKGVPLNELLKKHGDFTAVVDKTNWFDESAKPKKKPLAESEFEPDPKVEDGDL